MDFSSILYFVDSAKLGQGKIMKIAYKIMIVILIILALSSGSTKVMLMPQEVEFFGAYGFTNTILIIFGASQVVGGALMIPLKTRMYGSIIVAITFIVSLVVLFLAGSLVPAVITLIATVWLGLVAKQSKNA